MRGHVYFIQEIPDGAIKIGWTSTTPERRRIMLSGGNSNPLVLLGAIPAAPEAEADWHARYDYCHKHFEWFHPVPELVEAISLACQAGEKTADIKWDGAQVTLDGVVAWASSRGMSLEDFSASLGVARNRLRVAFNCDWGVGYKLAYKIQARTNGEIAAAGLLVTRKRKEQMRHDRIMKSLRGSKRVTKKAVPADSWDRT